MVFHTTEYCHEIKEEDDYEDWLVDTGSTTHIGRSIEKGYNVRNTKRTLRVGTRDSMESLKSFDLTFQDQVTGKTFGVSNIAMAPKFSKNIIGSDSFTEKRCTLWFGSEWCEIRTESGQVILRARKRNGLYYARLKRLDRHQVVDMVETSEGTNEDTTTS